MTASLAAGAALWLLSVGLGRLSGIWPAPWNGVGYAAAYLLPAGLCLFLLRREARALLAPPARAAWRRVLPLLPFFLLAVPVVSDITAAITGQETGGAALAGEPFLYAVLAHALLPAFLEEGLYRMALLPLFRRGAPRAAVPLTALLFALSHSSVGQMPYAFVGGLFLGFAAVRGGSAVCAFAFHFVNNLLSLCWQTFAPPRVAVYGTLCVLCVLGGAVMLLQKRRETAPVCRERRKP